MNVTQQRRLLTTAAGGLLLCAIGAGAWSFTDVASTQKTSQNRKAQSAVVDPIESQDTATQPRVDFSTKLTRTLYDAPPPPPKPVVVTPSPKPVPKPIRPPKLELTLVGTIIEPDSRIAMISDVTGKVDIKGVGEPLELSPEGVTVQEIKSEQVTLRYNGKDSIVKLQSDFKSAGGADRKANGSRRGNADRRSGKRGREE